MKTLIQHTSNHFAAAFNASTASLIEPRALSTSNQNINFSLRNWCKTEVILSFWAGCQEYMFTVHLFPLFHPLLPPFSQPIPMDYIPLYPLFINLNIPPIVCPMHPSSDSSLSLCDRRITILFYLYTKPQRRLVPFYFTDPFSHP